MIGRKIQNYKVLSLLGEGGMGIVYKVFDTQLERYAALKIITLNTLPNSSFVERFKREARNQAKLSHPNIVSVYGFVEEKDILGIAMEYIEGDTIESIIKNRGRIAIGYAVELMEQILNGVESAHNQGFIHRDLKPSNIILDLNGNPKIMDFGISKSIDELKTITQQNARPGTLLYMSPEQLSGNVVTIKSDLYALGITFYEMLTGYHPYNASTIYEIIDAHVNKNPEKISNQIDLVPVLVDEIILKAMNKSSYNNFNSASDFKAALVGLKYNQYEAHNDFVDDSPITESENKFPVKKKGLKNFNRVSNILLFILFIGLSVIVFNVVKTIIISEQNDTDPNRINYTQEYSVNPGSLNSTDWKLIKLETSANLNSISFWDDYSGIIVGDSGTIMQTSDGGNTWEKNKTDLNINLSSTFLIDDKLFFVGSSGFAGYKIRNQKTIKKIQLPTSETLFKIYFKDHTNGFIVGSNGLILKSNDGGISWRKIPINIKENLFSVFFADNKVGISVGWDGTIIRTMDEGLTWNSYLENYPTYLKDVLFVNEFLGFIIGGEGLILRTENGGNDWEEIEIDSESGLYTIRFDSNGDGIILSNRGEVFLSSDAGKTWNKKYVGAPIVLNDIHKLNSGNYIIAANNGNLIQSKINVR
jgi:serine/threonine-protein kinase